MRAYAELVIVAQDALALVPSGLDLIEAASLPLVALTGAQLIEEAVRPAKGELLLVTGAAGSVRRAAVFVARDQGARVLAGVRKSQLGEQLGAERNVAIDEDAEIAALPTLDAIADTVGGETIAKLIPKLRKGGSLGSVLGEPPAAKKRDDLRVTAFMAHPDGARLEKLAQSLRVPIAARYPLAQAGEAQARAERGGASGKILLTI